MAVFESFSAIRRGRWQFFDYFLPSALADDSFFVVFLSSALDDDSFYSLSIDFHLVHGNPQNDEPIIMT